MDNRFLTEPPMVTETATSARGEEAAFKTIEKTPTKIVTVIKTSIATNTSEKEAADIATMTRIPYLSDDEKRAKEQKVIAGNLGGILAATLSSVIDVCDK